MSDKSNIERREFLKMAGVMGAAGLSLPSPRIVGRNGTHEFLASHDQYGGFLVRQSSPENPPYQLESSVYRRFREKNQVFSRVRWEKESMDIVRKYRRVRFERIENNDPGFSRLEYAFSNVAWFSHRTKSFYRWTSPGRSPLGRWEPEGISGQDVTSIIKKVALFYGASLAGVTELNHRWVYSKAFIRGDRSDVYRDGVGMYDEPNRENLEIPVEFDDIDQPVKNIRDRKFIIPRSMKYVIAMAIEMDGDCMEYGTTCLAGAATGNGYSRMAETAGTLAQFIRALGYNAIPMGNDTALSIPIAVDAGLGELGRNGLLITPKYGPRVRLCKVLTDLPLVADKPIRFGVTEFCQVCGKCAKLCPSSSIIEGERNTSAHDMSNNPGVLKWPVKMLTCYTFWRQNGSDCSNCISVCPFNKPDTWVHQAARILIGAKSGNLNKLLLKLDDASGYGAEKDSASYWRKNNFVHIKA
jgi:reductive dehalogenase